MGKTLLSFVSAILICLAGGYAVFASEKEQTATPSTVAVFSVTNFDAPTSQIPYYYQGAILFLSKGEIEQFKQGHQPWRSSPFQTIVSTCNNLIPSTITNDLAAGVQNKDIFTNKDGVPIKMLQEPDGTVNAEIVAPNYGRYSITLKKPKDVPVYFVSKINFTRSQSTIEGKTKDPKQ